MVVMKAIKALTQRTAACHRIAEGDDGRRPAGRPLTSPLDKLGASRNAWLKSWTLDFRSSKQIFCIRYDTFHPSTRFILRQSSGPSACSGQAARHRAILIIRFDTFHEGVAQKCERRELNIPLEFASNIFPNLEFRILFPPSTS